jgi:hypothetical protein
MKLLTRAIEKRLPAIGATEKQGDDAVAQTRFFCLIGNMRWWPTEYDPVRRLFFGLVTGGDCDELGYFSLDELLSLQCHGNCPAVERDISQKPITLGEVRRQFGRDAA